MATVYDIVAQITRSIVDKNLEMAELPRPYVEREVWSYSWNERHLRDAVCQVVGNVSADLGERTNYLRAAVLGTTVLAFRPFVNCRAATALWAGWFFLCQHGAGHLSSASSIEDRIAQETDYLETQLDATNLPAVSLDDPLRTSALSDLDPRYNRIHNERLVPHYRTNYVCSIHNPHLDGRKLCQLIGFYGSQTQP